MTPRPALPARPVEQVGVSGHRGASFELPENTLAAFRRALEHGADGIELDVALTSDGVAVVLHDESVDRTTDGTGSVADLTLAQVRALDAGGGERVPTLDEVLALAAGRAEVNIEIKAADAAPAVAEVVARHPGLTWFASSGQWDALEELLALVPGARVYPLTLGVAGPEHLRAIGIAAGYTDEQIDVEIERFSHLGRPLHEALDFAARVGAAGVSTWAEGLGAQDVATIHAAGLAAWVWTINDADRAEELMRMGVDAICTDDPATLLARRAAVAG
ncbi:glycerophosphodiester phosphodiesterase [Cellulomonas triticagri]|uniref:glycerophosphodiester phosphodiesterase n=1 Tax=Cellulomonas triticagri TaxID=2483352 RepID=UPI001315AA8A|nr:glycerophosphodiester phosphodiesterase family protein [Cellulomonas triticagri]